MFIVVFTKSLGLPVIFVLVELYSAIVILYSIVKIFESSAGSILFISRVIQLLTQVKSVE